MTNKIGIVGALGTRLTAKRYRWQGLIAMAIAVAIAVIGLHPASFAFSFAEASGLQMLTSTMSAEEQFQVGMEHYRSGDLEGAIAPWQTALDHYRHDQNLTRERHVLELLTFVHLELRRYRPVLSLAEQTLAIASESDTTPLRVRTYANLGIAHNALGSYLEAIEAYQNALAEIQTLTDASAAGYKAQVLGLLANAHDGLGNYERTVELHRQSLDLAQQLNNPTLEATTRVNLGSTFARLGDYHQAIGQYRLSLEGFQALNDIRGMTYALNNLGVAYYGQRKFTLAIDQLQQALTIAQDSQQPDMVGAALGSLGSLYADQRDYRQALDYLEQSLDSAIATDNPVSMATALNNLGHTLFETGQLEAAEDKLYAAVEILESLRPGLDDANQISLFDTQVLTYNLLQQILVAQGKIETALEVAERGRARAFVELVANQTNSLTESTHAPTIQQIRNIAQWQQSTLVEYTLIPDNSFRFQGKQRGSAESLYIWVVQPTGDIFFRQVDLKSIRQERNLSIDELVSISRDLSGIRGDADADSSSDSRSGFATSISRPKYWRTLHQLLIEPIADLLPDDPAARVVFIPQEQLFLVPFPALQADDGSYLIEHHTLLTAPAIQILALTNRDRTEAGPPLVVGNPSPMPNELLPLPHAGTEALGVAQLLATYPLIGADATETAIKQQLSTASLIHLATHGFFNESNPLEGALAFAPTDEQDGFLTAAEILSQSLQAELVVLSACDTGRGKITGDGVIGLSRSFLAAGANNVVVSLWRVPDDATAELMVEFHRQRQQLDNAQALRQAMLTIYRKYEDPNTWAAFTLIGAIS